MVPPSKVQLAVPPGTSVKLAPRLMLVPRAAPPASTPVIVPTLARLVGAGSETARLWRYYWDTIETCASPQQVVATLSAAGIDAPLRRSFGDHHRYTFAQARALLRDS